MLTQTPPSNKRLSQINAGGVRLWNRNKRLHNHDHHMHEPNTLRAKHSVRNSSKNMAEQTTTEVHRCYDVSFKLRAVEVAEKESKASAARQLKVAPKRIGPGHGD